jgi:hypothetical protein
MIVKQTARLVATRIYLLPPFVLSFDERRNSSTCLPQLLHRIRRNNNHKNNSKYIGAFESSNDGAKKSFFYFVTSLRDCVRGCRFFTVRGVCSCAKES